MRIGACQTPEILGDIDRSIACIEALATERSDVDLLLFPECFLQGYLVEPRHLRDNAIDLASRAFQDVLARLSGLRPTLVFGVIEQAGPKYFNTAVVVRGGVLAASLIVAVTACSGAGPTIPAPTPTPTPTPIQVAPPFSGTIFIDPDIITASDPTTFQMLTPKGQGVRTMFDRRVGAFIQVQAYLFDATFSDGLTAEVQVNPEFGSVDAARVQADKYALVIGRLPRALRVFVATVWIHQGIQPFGGGNNNLLIHVGQETFVHEAS